MKAARFRRFGGPDVLESGRFSLPVARTFPLTEIARAHRAVEDSQVRGKLVLLIG